MACFFDFLNVPCSFAFLLLHLKWQALPEIFASCFQRAHSVWWWCYYLGFCQSSCWSPLFLLPLVAEFLTFCLLLFLQVSGLAMETSLFFSRRWHCSSGLWFLPCPHTVAYFPSPFVYSSLVFAATLGSMHKELLQSEGRCGFSFWSTGSAWGSGTPRGSWVDFLPSAISRKDVLCLPLSPSPPSPQSQRSYFSTLGAAGKNGFLQPLPAQLG